MLASGEIRFPASARAAAVYSCHRLSVLPRCAAASSPVSVPPALPLPANRRVSALAPPCCMGRRCGRTELDPCSGSCDADVLRAPQLQHLVQHVGCDGHVWTTASVQGKNGRSATWSGAVMCPASNDAVRMTAGHDEFHGSGPNHLAAHFVPWPSRVFPIPA